MPRSTVLLLFLLTHTLQPGRPRQMSTSVISNEHHSAGNQISKSTHGHAMPCRAIPCCATLYHAMCTQWGQLHSLLPSADHQQHSSCRHIERAAQHLQTTAARTSWWFGSQGWSLWITSIPNVCHISSQWKQNIYTNPGSPRGHPTIAGWKRLRYCKPRGTRVEGINAGLQNKPCDRLAAAAGGRWAPRWTRVCLCCRTRRGWAGSRLRMSAQGGTAAIGVFSELSWAVSGPTHMERTSWEAGVPSTSPLSKTKIPKLQSSGLKSACWNPSEGQRDSVRSTEPRASPQATLPGLSLQCPAGGCGFPTQPQHSTAKAMLWSASEVLATPTPLLHLPPSSCLEIRKSQRVSGWQGPLGPSDPSPAYVGTPRAIR